MKTKNRNTDKDIDAPKPSKRNRIDSSEELLDKFGLTVRSIQRDPLLAALNEDASHIQVGVKSMRKEVEKYLLTSIDLETAKPGYFGIDPTFENPLKDIRKIGKVMLDIQAYRGRMVKILGDLNDKLTTLQEYRAKSTKYMKEKYSKTLKLQGSLKNQDEFMDYVMWPVVTRIRKIRALVEFAESVSKNLDSAWFVYHKLSDICETLRSRMETGGGREHSR